MHREHVTLCFEYIPIYIWGHVYTNLESQQHFSKKLKNGIFRKKTELFLLRVAETWTFVCIPTFIWKIIPKWEDVAHSAILPSPILLEILNLLLSKIKIFVLLNHLIRQPITLLKKWIKDSHYVFYSYSIIEKEALKIISNSRVSKHNRIQSGPFPRDGDLSLRCHAKLQSEVRAEPLEFCSNVLCASSSASLPV